MYNYNSRPPLSAPTTLGIDEKWERVLCYVLGWLSGIFFLLVEQRNPTVRRHAIQSIVVFGVLSIVGLVAGWFSGILFLGFFFTLLRVLVGIVTAVAWVALMIFAYMSPATFIDSGSRRYI
jgi:uncharacterized membrane protein